MPRASPCSTAWRQSRSAESAHDHHRGGEQERVGEEGDPPEAPHEVAPGAAPHGHGERGGVDDAPPPPPRPPTRGRGGRGGAPGSRGRRRRERRSAARRRNRRRRRARVRGVSAGIRVRPAGSPRDAWLPSIAAPHPPDSTNATEAALSLSPDGTAAWLIETIPVGGRGGGHCDRGKPLDDTHSLSPFRPAPDERTPPLVSPPIPRARRRLSGAGRIFSTREVNVHQTAQSGTFLAEVMAQTPGGEALQTCLQCGTCGGSCPSGPDMDHTPRAALRPGRRRRARGGPEEQHALVLRLLLLLHGPLPAGDPHHRRHVHAQADLGERRGSTTTATAPDFSETFIGFVEQLRALVRAGPRRALPPHRRPLARSAMGPMALGMVLKDRLAVRPDEDPRPRQLQAILAKAKALEKGSWPRAEGRA